MAVRVEDGGGGEGGLLGHIEKADGVEAGEGLPAQAGDGAVVALDFVAVGDIQRDLRGQGVEAVVGKNAFAQLGFAGLPGGEVHGGQVLGGVHPGVVGLEHGHAVLLREDAEGDGGIVGGVDSAAREAEQDREEGAGSHGEVFGGGRGLSCQGEPTCRARGRARLSSLKGGLRGGGGPGGARASAIQGVVRRITLTVERRIEGVGVGSNLMEEAYVVKKAICYGSLPAKKSDKQRAELAKEAGLDAVELHQYPTIAEAEKVAGIVREAGLEIASVMCMTHWGSPLSSTDEEVRTKGVTGVAEALRQAQAIGTDVVLVVPGVVTEDVSYKAAYENSRRSLGELLPVAEETGVTMALENVWNRFLLSPLEMRDFIDSFGSPLVAAYFDVGNILLYGYPHHWIEALKKRIKRVHIKDFDTNTRQFVGLLQGSVDYPRVMAALRGVGYHGYITAELSAYGQYPEQFVRDTAAQLEQIVKS